MFGIDDAALAAMLAGAISTAGNIYINKKNRDAQADANAINWEIARQNNATQIEMANTAHQREVRDLRAAGLNPILSAGGHGAATPSLQAPTINPVHQDSPFEGLANSAKGVARYLSQEYKTGIQQMQADVKSAEAQAEMDRYDANARSRNVELDNINRDIDIMKSRLESEELEKLTHITRSFRDDDGRRVFHRAWEPTPELKNAVRDGIISDAKLRANSNWRANLSSFVPFVSPAAVNSGASAVQHGINSARSIRAFKKGW